MALQGKSESTLYNYTRYLAKLGLHYNRLPTELSIEEVDDYLYMLLQRHQSPSRAYFKFTICGLRFAYRTDGLMEKHIALPSIKKEKTLPVILSKQEVKRLLEAPKMLKHRVLLGLLYGCGLRCFESRNIQIADLDFDRNMLHVRQGKGKKDRYVPLSSILVEWLKQYIKDKNPEVWLFNRISDVKIAGDIDFRYSQKGVQYVVKQAARAANIIKNISPHTLRHTFATHLIEDGLDILSVKDLLGHQHVRATLIYLHVAQYEKAKSFSPLDTIYGVRQPKNSCYSGEPRMLKNIYCCTNCQDLVFSKN